MEAIEVEELFISAAFADADIPVAVGPRLRKVSLPYLHEENDMRDWSAADRETARKTFDPDASRRSREAVELWERANDLIRLVECQKARRSLWAWAKSRAGGKTLKAWCAAEGISTETGRRRKDRAVSIIATKTSERPVEADCPVACTNTELMPETRSSAEIRPVLSWQDEQASTARLVVVAQWRGWQQERNALRRKQMSR